MMKHSQNISKKIIIILAHRKHRNLEQIFAFVTNEKSNNYNYNLFTYRISPPSFSAITKHHIGLLLEQNLFSIQNLFDGNQPNGANPTMYESLKNTRRHLQSI